MNYESVNFYMLRTPYMSVNKYLDLISLHEEELENNDLSFLMEDKTFMELVSVASIDMFKSLMKSLSSKSFSKNACESLLKYYIRATTRTTPFGLLAGISTGSFSEKNTLLRSGSEKDNSKKCMVDLEWLYGVIKLLENDINILLNLKVRFNDHCYICGNKLKNLYISNYGQTYNTKIVKIKGEENNKVKKSRINYTKQVEFTKNISKKFVKFSFLYNKLLEHNPEVPTKIIMKFLKQLIDNEILITNIRPPIHINNQLDFLINELQILVPNINSNEIILNLTEINKLIKEYNKKSIGSSINDYKNICEKMKKIYETKSYLNSLVKIKLCDDKLSYKIKDEIDNLSDLIIALGTEDNESPTIRRFKNKFIDKYGRNLEVSLLELFDSDMGIGNPYEIKQYDEENKLNMTSKYHMIENVIKDKILLSCISGKNFIEIDENDLEYFKSQDSDLKLNYSKSIALNFIIDAKDSNAINKGEFNLFLGPNVGSFLATNSMNRFYNILDEKDKNILDSLYESEIEKTKDEYIIADAYELPNYARNNNICGGNCNYDYSISLGLNSNENSIKISLSDLYIGVDTELNRLYIKSKKFNQIIKVVSDNMLTTQANNDILRFLREISYAYEIHPLETLLSLKLLPFKYLPQLRYKNTILQNEMWKLKGLDFSDLNNFENFKSEYQTFSKKWKIPKYVYYTDFDRRILLDTSSNICLQQLFKALNNNKFEEVILTALEASYIDETWFRDENDNKYFSEIVVPYQLKGENVTSNFSTCRKDIILDTKSNISKNKSLISIIDKNRLIYFGDSNWSYFKIYINNSEMDEFIGKYLNMLVNQLLKEKLVEQFFFIRYADPKPQIRLRIKRINKSNLNIIIDRFQTWFNLLIQEGVCYNYAIETYDKEIERYGGIKAISKAEEVFYYDSVLVQYILSMKQDKLLKLNDIQIGMAFVYNIINCFIDDKKVQENFLNSIVDNKAFRDDYVKNRKEYIKFLDINLFSEIDINLKYLIEKRECVITEYRDLLNDLDDLGCLTNNISDILSSITHMFCNRFKGDNVWEGKIVAFIRHALHDKNERDKYLKRL